MKIALLNHGCAKNLVDSELMLGMLNDKGHEITLDETDADVVIINTCSFIHDAERESVQAILQMVNNGKKVIVTGCLPQKYKEELKEAIPEIAGMVGTANINEIVSVVDKINSRQDYVTFISEKPEYIYPENVERRQITVGASSYVKIADGCNYHCGYCIIPQLRGEYRSRTMENIIEEVKHLVKKGVTEVVLIAQDTTSYGIDLYNKLALPELLKKLNSIDGLGWIRIMYAYPSNITDELLDTIEKCDKVVKYLDLPLQHANSEILRAMRRPVMDYEALIAKIRKKVPNIGLRSAFIVGYPGETEEQFDELYNFISRVNFEKMGVFEYSREKNTISYSMEYQIPENIKKQRREKLMKLQQSISKNINESYIGKTISCIVEGFTDDGLIILRSEHDAPEIDGLVYATADDMPVPGDIENVKIEKADEYDLYGILK